MSKPNKYDPPGLRIGPKAMVIMTKGGPRGMTKDEIRDGLDQSKEKQRPAILEWEYKSNDTSFVPGG